MTAGAIGNISINVTAEAVAWYAAVIATFSAVKVVYDILADRRKIRLSYRTDVRIQGHGYDENEQQFCLEVVNIGKRTVKIVNAGYFTKDGNKNLLSDSLFNLEQRSLNDNNPSTSYFVPLKNVEVSKIWYIYALDGRGKVYKKYAYRFAPLRHIPVFIIRYRRKKTEKQK